MPSRSAPYRPAAPIIAELSAGAVILSPSGDRTLLLHLRDEDRWCFPKGHVDPGESLAAAALREVREETGLRGVRLAGELDTVSYRFYRPASRVNVYKTVVYFRAVAAERPPRTEPIFDRAGWVSLRRALQLVRFETDRQVLVRLTSGPRASITVRSARPRSSRSKE